MTGKTESDINSINSDIDLIQKTGRLCGSGVRRYNS